jgi:FkbM family methyltransferase
MGQFSIAARYRFPDALIHSFEPVPDTFNILLKNIGSRVPNVHLHKMALGSEVGEISFYQNNYSHVSSALPISTDNKQDKYQVGLAKTIKVPVSTLDKEFDTMLFDAPILLKLDVQGYEKVVLEGGNNFLKKVKYVLLEMPFTKLYENQFTFTEINDYLVSCGFEMHQPLDFNYGTNFQIIEMDALYKRIDTPN